MPLLPQVLKHMMQLDNDDHMVMPLTLTRNDWTNNSNQRKVTFRNSSFQFAKHRLLRCYLDSAEAGEARALLDSYPEEPYCCFAYSRALIECIALLLDEGDASVDLIDAALAKGTTLQFSWGSPGTVWYDVLNLRKHSTAVASLWVFCVAIFLSWYASSNLQIFIRTLQPMPSILMDCGPLPCTSISLTQWSMSTELKTNMLHHTASLMR